MFVANVTIQEQVIATNNGMEVSWNVTVSQTQAFARAAAMEMEMEAYY